VRTRLDASKRKSGVREKGREGEEKEIGLMNGHSLGIGSRRIDSKGSEMRYYTFPPRIAEKAGCQTKRGYPHTTKVGKEETYLGMI